MFSRPWYQLRVIRRLIYLLYILPRFTTATDSQPLEPLTDDFFPVLGTAFNVFLYFPLLTCSPELGSWRRFHILTILTPSTLKPNHFVWLTWFSRTGYKFTELFLWYLWLLSSPTFSPSSASPGLANVVRCLRILQRKPVVPKFASQVVITKTRRVAAYGKRSFWQISSSVYPCPVVFVPLYAKQLQFMASSHASEVRTSKLFQPCHWIADQLKLHGKFQKKMSPTVTLPCKNAWNLLQRLYNKPAFFGEKGWCSGDSNRPQPMWPGFDSRTRCQI